MIDYCKNGHPQPAGARNASGQCRECKREAQQRYLARGRQRTSDTARGLWEDERVLRWVAEQDKKKATREDMMAWSKEGTHGWPIPGTHLGQNAVNCCRVILKDRETRPAAATGRPSWNGKSANARRRDANSLRGRNPGTARTLHELSKMIAVLEDISPADFEMDGLGPWEIGMVYEDLVSLGEWWDRTTSAVQGWLEDGDVKKKIAILRNSTGRTPEEAATAARLAARLERKLEAKLVQ